MPMTAISTTYGSLLLGSSLAYCLTGILCFQCATYFRTYPEDRHRTKILVSVVWLLDLTHSSFVCASLVYYFLTNFGNRDKIDHIPWSIAFSVAVTGVQTFIVQCFFANRILKSSRGNWYITVPIVCLAFARLLAASVSTGEMIHAKKYSAIVKPYPGWIITLGISLASGTDLLITVWLCYFLLNLRDLTGSTIMVQAVNLLIRYTLETVSLTCVATLASLLCWLTMRTNLIFLGIHFVAAKLYANSLVASLNARQELRALHSRNSGFWAHPTPPNISFSLSDPARSPTVVDESRSNDHDTEAHWPKVNRPVEVNVVRTVEFSVSSEHSERQRRQQQRP